jgi:hypothetical protein
MQASRMARVTPPYSELEEKLFANVMPEGMDPPVLFRVLARSERTIPRFMREAGARSRPGRNPPSAILSDANYLGSAMAKIASGSRKPVSS